MTDAPAVDETFFDDPNFKKLIDGKVDTDEFTRVVEEHVKGYSQKKHLHDGLKDFVKKIEDAEQRLYVAKQVGKAKAQTNYEDKELTTLYSSEKLRPKMTALNAILEAMIEGGSITHLEKPKVLDNIRTRLAKAKEAGKAKLEEKLDKMLSSVARAESSFALPVANIAEFHRLDTEIQKIEKAEKLKAKDKKLDKTDVKTEKREKLVDKAALQAEFEALEEGSRMWFETALEFHPRVREAVLGFAAAEKERKKQEEDEAFQKKIQEEDEAQEKRRLEAARKEAEMAKELDDKLKAKRVEAAAKPVKEVAPKPQKESKPILPPKPKVKKTDDALAKLTEEKDDLWETLAQQEAERRVAEEAAAKAAEEEADRLQVEEEAALAAEEAAWSAAEAEKEARKAEEIAKLKKQVEDANKKKEEFLAKERQETEREQLEREKKEAAAKAALNPSISLKHGAAKPTQPEEAAAKPKPKRKPPAEVASKWGTPVHTMQIDDDGGDVLERLAAQEAKENAERAVAKKAAEEEAARLEAAEEAARVGEEAALAEKEAARLKQKLDASKKPTNGASVAAAAKPAAPPSISVKQEAAKPTETVTATPVAKAKRSPPVERESKWGKPVAPAFEYDGEDLLEKLAAQEAKEKKERAQKAAEAAAAAAEAAEDDGETAGAEKENHPVPQVAAEKERQSAGPSLAESKGPSLAEAAKAPKKTPAAAQPKKKEKKTWAKLDGDAVGFDADNPNL